MDAMLQQAIDAVEEELGEALSGPSNLYGTVGSDYSQGAPSQFWLHYLCTKWARHWVWDWQSGKPRDLPPPYEDPASC